MIVVWRVTESCNLGCRFCAYDQSMKRSRREADADLILSFGKVLAEYAKTTGDAVLVSWLGGEPLLWPPLKDLSEVYHCRFGLKVSTTTNGSTLLSKEMRAHLLEHYAELTVSVDGLSDTHDALRGWSGGFAKIRQGVRTMADEKQRFGRGPRLRANVVLMRDNFEEFEPLCIELASWGVDAVTFNQLGGMDRPEFFPDNRLLPQQADRLAAELPRLRSQLAMNGLQLHGGLEYLRRIQATTIDAKLPVADCFPGSRFLFIDEAGMAAPCSFTVNDLGLPLERIDSAQALCALGSHFSIGRRRILPAACTDCHSTQVFDKFTGDQ